MEGPIAQSPPKSAPERRTADNRHLLHDQEFGGPLFHRERQNMHLTELGRMLHPHLSDIYKTTLSARQLAREYGRLKRTQLKLGIMSTVAPDELIDLIGAIKNCHPGLELHLSDSDTKSLRSHLLEGQLELAIYALPGGSRTNARTFFHCFGSRW